jgi:hypothetical protein
MANRRDARNAIPDLKARLDADFNAFVGLALEGLATQQNSPVYTGFFASSWKAATQRIRPQDRVEDFSPWSALKKRRNKGETTAFKIAPRHPVPTFRYTTKVFIGNTAQYAAYALENPKVARFVQGELRSLIQSTFTERRGPNVLIGTTKGTGGLGFLGRKTYVSYEKV